MESRRKTFDEVQRSARRASLVVFALLVLFYFVAAASGWLMAKAFFLLFSGKRVSDGLGGLLHGPRELLIIFAVALGVALLHWFEAVGSGVNRILASLGAVPPDSHDRYHRALVNVAEEMKIAACAERVEVLVIPVAAMNAFSLTDFRGRSVIGVTEGLVSRMSRPQLQAVVAHEMAHVREGDNLMVTISCSLFGVFSQMLNAVRVAMESDGRAVFLYPAFWFLAVGAYFLNVTVSRQREYLADATAVELCRNPVALAEALYKLARHWRGGGVAREELAPIFIVGPSARGLEESDGFLADLFSTHPPIRRRIRALLRMARTGMASLLQRMAEESTEPVGEGGGTREAPGWIARHLDDWKGPFTPAELAAEPWFSPLTWVARAGSGEVVPARSMPELHGLLGIGPVGSGARGGCPVCRVPLADREYEGIVVRRCPSCGGMLLRRGQDQRILTREEERFTARQRRKAESFMRLVSFRPGRNEQKEGDPLPLAYRCPDCGGKMRRQLYSYQYFLEVDRCRECGLTWFDADELEMLQIMVERGRNSGG